MNKTILCMALGLISFSGFSQVEKGKHMLGGSLSFSINSPLAYEGSSQSPNSSSQTTRDQNTSFLFGATPMFGKFIRPNLLLGGLLGYNLNTSGYTTTTTTANTTPETYTYESKQKSQGLAAGVFSRYYIMSDNNRFGFFGQGTLSGGYTKSAYSNKDDYSSWSTKYSQWSVGLSIRPGIVYFITPKLGIEATFGNLYCNYNQTISNSDNNNQSGTYNQSSKNKSSTINGGLLMNLNNFVLGAAYYF